MGAAAGFNCSVWKIRRLDGSGEVLAASGSLELVQEAGIFTFHAAPNVFFKHFGPYIERTRQ